MIGRTNTGGGGSVKGTDAILRVIAPAGSTVTISKGGVSKSDAGHENASDPYLYDYYFIIHQSQFDSINSWTVTATLGAKTASDTVLIDSSDEYDVALIYDLYLFNNGDQCTTITGGWVDGAKAASSYTVVPVSISTDIYYNYTSATRQSMAMTNNKISLSNGDTIRVNCSFTGKFAIYVSSSNATGWYTGSRLATYETTTTSQTVHDLAITSDMEGYVIIGAFGSNAVPSGNGSITEALIVRA